MSAGDRPGAGRRRRGIESIELRVTPDDLEVGIPTFYSKQGFRDGGRLIFEYVPD